MLDRHRKIGPTSVHTILIRVISKINSGDLTSKLVYSSNAFFFIGKI